MEQKNYKRTTVTAALPYANGPVHIGHLAGVYVPADIYTRYLRLKGREVMFVCGSDEHGVPVTIRAKKEGCTVQDVVDRYHGIIKKSFADFGISFDIYSRTTSKIHHQFAADFFKKLYDEGKFVEITSEQFYDEETKQFLTDRNIKGECPRCHNEGAYGDQCEKCGATLSPEELINPVNAINGNPLVKKATKHWYLPLDQYQGWLEDWILKGHPEWRSNVYGQCKSWLDSGLKPRAVTRDLDWGIPVPVEGAEGKVLYVWFDAPIGYISNTKELCESAPEKWGTWQKWWQDEDTRLVHFIGKDNIVFHCIVFPSMLKAHGDYILPDNVPSNEFLNLEGNKISTSKNYAVWLNEYLEELPDRQDELRYVLTANAPETKDNVEKLIEGFKFREAQKEAMNLARIGNKYIADEEPWKVIKTDPERVKTVIYISLQLTANLAIAFEPFLPFSSAKLREMIAMDTLNWEDLGKTDLLPAGKQLGKPSLLFSKIEDETIQFQTDKLAATIKANEEANAEVVPVKDTVAFDDFTKLDIRVATVLQCERVPKMKKLLKFHLDDGTPQGRTIVSGIAQWYEPEALVGKQVLFIANLAPRTFKNGLVSEGMILSAENWDGTISVTTVEHPVKAGSLIS